MRLLLKLGFISALIFILGTIIFGWQLDNYDPISQTVSEIGKLGSPLLLEWKVFVVGNGMLLILFSIGVINYAKKRQFHIFPGILILCYGVSQALMGMFPSPHHLHNIFGLSLLVGYFTSLSFAIQWKSKVVKGFKTISTVVFILTIIGIYLNISPAFDQSLFPIEYYGVIQRFLLFTTYLYFAILSLTIDRSNNQYNVFTIKQKES